MNHIIEYEIIPQKIENPIIIDLNNNGIYLSNARNSKVMIHNGAKIEKIGWPDAKDGILTFEYNGQGPIEHKNFVLTDNVPGATSDLQALQFLANKNGGVLDSQNPFWNKFGIWQDVNQNGLMDQGEYQTLTQSGVSSISLSQSGAGRLINGNIVYGELSVTYANGNTAKAINVGLHYEDVIQSNSNNVTNELSSSMYGANSQRDISIELAIDNILKLVDEM